MQFVLLDLPYMSSLDYSHTEDEGRMAVGFILLLMGSCLAASGGIGGGGIVSGIMLVIFQFQWQTAVVLSISAVAGNTIAQVAINFRKRHPFEESRPLMYWDALLILLPAQLGGANVGVFIVGAFPNAILIILATAVLLFATIKLVLKGSRLWMKERDYMSDLEGGEDAKCDPEQAQARVDNDVGAGARFGNANGHTSNNSASDLDTSIGRNRLDMRAHILERIEKNSRRSQSMVASIKSQDDFASASASASASAPAPASAAASTIDYSIGRDEVRSHSTGNIRAGTGTGTGTCTGLDNMSLRMSEAAIIEMAHDMHDFQFDFQNVVSGDAASTTTSISPMQPPQRKQHKQHKEIVVTDVNANVSFSFSSSILTVPLTSQVTKVEQASVNNTESNSNHISSYILQPELIYPLPIVRTIIGLWWVYAVFILLVKTPSIATTCSNNFFIINGLSGLPICYCIYWGVNYVCNYQRSYPHSCLIGDMDLQGVRRKAAPTTGTGTTGAGNTSKSSDGLCICLQPLKPYIPSIFAFLIGVMCSLLGIGGGELMGPLMLTLGVLPQVSSATTSAMSMASSCMNLIHYFLADMLDPRWFAYLFISGAIGGISGRQLAMWVNITYARPSITVYLLSSVLFFSVCLMVYRLVNSSGGDFTNWSALC